MANATNSNAITINIDGVTYQTSLSPNPRIHPHYDSSTEGSTHFIGTLEEHAESWARLSLIDEQWQGVLSIYGTLHVITPSNSTFNNATLMVSTIAAKNSNIPMSCGASPLDDNLSSLSNKTVLQQTIDYNSLCSGTLEGVCMMAELEMAFDLAFQQTFASETESQIDSILNIVEGYYINDLNIGFDRITTELLDSEQFSTSTDPTTLLGDIQSKKINQQLPFIKNNRAIFHLVTGREFDGSTVGVAYVGTICNNNGFSSGTSQLIGNNIPLTALVIAHEIGHNFGSDHDEDSCGTGFIMAASLNASASQFSTCSTDSMQSTISATDDINQCMNFAVDLSISEAETNVDEAEQGSEITDQFDLSVTSIFQPVTMLSVTGSVDNSEGEFTSVSIGGNSCDISNEGQNYQCNLNNPLTTNEILTTLLITGEQLTTTHSITTITPDNVIDVNFNNNTLTRSLDNITPPSETPPSTTSDNTSTEVSETPESTSSSNNEADSSSGGGGAGSMHWPLLILLMVWSILNRIRLIHEPFKHLLTNK